MVDVLTPRQRKFCMSRIRGKDTKPEIIVRRVVHSLGYRYRLHVRTLPGCPDIVLARHKKVIFVHGCFWHRHNCKYGRVRPATRKMFWEAKLNGNKERDKRIRRKLRKKGWAVTNVWECQIRKPEILSKRIQDFLKSGI
jgi:DNA mismatch endonuclease, patch repair protein